MFIYYVFGRVPVGLKEFSDFYSSSILLGNCLDQEETL